MQKSFLIFIISLVTNASVFSQKRPTIIWGTVDIGNNMSMKATEVTIQEWMCFIINNNFDSSLFPKYEIISLTTRQIFDDLKKKEEALYLKLETNYGSRRNNYGFFGIRAKKNIKSLLNNDLNYFTLDLPISGITYEQARRYCKWREKLINNSQEIKIQITLPEIDVYKKVINNKDSLCRKKCDTCEQFLMNCLSSSCYVIDKSKQVLTQGRNFVRVDSYWPTDLGLYNLQGNAAEMTSTNGIAMGGSFRHFARNSFNDQIQEYFGPQDWLGFRFVVILQ